MKKCDNVTSKFFHSFFTVGKSLKKKIVMKEEKEAIEMMKLNEMGCSEKCRIKNLQIEIDLKKYLDNNT